MQFEARKAFVTSTSLMKSSGAVLIGKGQGASLGALWSWMKRVLSLSRLVSIFKSKGIRSPASSFKILVVSLLELDVVVVVVKERCYAG